MVDVHYVIDDVCCFLFRLWTSWYGFGVNFLCLRELRLLVFCFVCIIVGIVGVHVYRFASVLSCRLTSLSVRQIVRLYVYLFRNLLLLFGLVRHQIGIYGGDTV